LASSQATHATQRGLTRASVPFMGGPCQGVQVTVPLSK